MKRFGALAVFMALLCSFAPGSAAAAEGDGTLPIFMLKGPSVSAASVQAMAAGPLAVAGPTKVQQLADRVVLQSEKSEFEVYRRSGGIWTADKTQLWNIQAKPELPTEEQARQIADKYLQSVTARMGAGLGLAAEEAAGKPALVQMEYGRQAGTLMVTYDVATGKRTVQKLDVQVMYDAKVRVPGADGEKPQTYPVVGGGGEMNVILGNGGRVIGFNGVWRPIDEVKEYSPVVPRAEADAQFRKRVGGLKLDSVDASLAYYSAPAADTQVYLYPVYVYRAMAEIDGHKVPLRNVLVPATEFGPTKGTRTGKRRPRPGSLRDGDDEPAAAPQGRPGRGARAARAVPWECGASYIGASGGLSGSKNNAKGFVDGLRGAGWKVNFFWGDAAAWESDWNRLDDDWVDAADFVFYTGHASMDGWVLSKPDDTFLHYTEVGKKPDCTGGDMWGRQDLEWIAIAACGPLQDEVLAKGGGDVFRWAGAFDGLHLLLGYGAVTFDNEAEGKRLVQYCLEGKPIIDAWFRAAKEIQPSSNGCKAPNGPTIYVGAVYVLRSGQPSPANDRIWGQGTVAPDPCNPNVYVAIWSPT